MTNNAEDQIIKIDDVEYKLDNLSDNAKAQLASIQFVDEQLQQLNNEWAVSDTYVLIPNAKAELNKMKLASNSHGSKDQIRRQGIRIKDLNDKAKATLASLVCKFESARARKSANTTEACKK